MASMHRRAATLKNFKGPSNTGLAADDMGQLRESPEETLEDVLRRQLLEKEKENDKLRAQNQALQLQLKQRPPQEHIEKLEKEYNQLELILQGTQKENEKSMNELANSKAREKQLEKELAKVMGDDWRDNIDITSSPAPVNAFAARSAAIRRGQTASASNTSLLQSSTDAPAVSGITAAQIEQVRMLILGMEQRLQKREEKLDDTIERAENEGRKFQQIRKDLLSNS